ncbi:hypothetical protein FRC0514_02190 [Corynebacterium diphtheriae]|nr:hypothetical protein CIP107515_02089 [Corynebacterium diphtheriae]CAB0969171.1 hypothetical protein FRC0469_01999 [Corynebacterium diphtheriae]CAB0970597.1 hypothetical protein FRC0477_02016 [Corynebacterium diphtheriae]CAB1012146.1 hypothetical protein FRC0514_02190 [Corynebacterium diphtheriae]CAB1022722.1 hypothetical protein FRC0521_02013 [Corynebacterium diphtheriae]
MDNVGGNRNRQTLRRTPHRIRQLLIRLMIHQKHRRLGNLCRPPVQLEAVELPNRQFLLPLNIQRHARLAATLTDSHNKVRFNFSQLFIDGEQEVSRPTRRVAEHQLSKGVTERF